MKDIAYPIKTRDDLIQLINALALEIQDNPDAWENNDLSSFLQAMSSWIEDSDGYYKNMNEPMPSDSVWRVVADALMAARIYE